MSNRTLCEIPEPYCHNSQDREAYAKGWHARDAELAALEAIVEKLPKTADGVPVVPGMKVWGVIDGEVPMFTVEIVRVDEIVGHSERGSWGFNQSTFQCYSTRSAAEAAAKEVAKA